MVLKIALFFSFVFVVLSSTAFGKTIVETDWKEISYCVDDGLGLANDGGSRARIRMTRKFDDGTYQVKFLWRDCGDECECWKTEGWADIGSYPTDGLPASVDGGGNWTLQNVPLGKGGSFVASGAGIWDLVLSPFSTVLFVPAGMAS